MSINTRVIECPPELIFEILSDGWLYPGWVVGAARMRAVDESWPDPGAQLHHSAGAWPALIDDRTRMIEWRPPHRAALRAKGWPIGEAGVVIDVKPHSAGCIVRVQEQAVAGPALLVPRFAADLMLHARNRETLRRLAHLAEGRMRGRGAATDAASTGVPG